MTKVKSIICIVFLVCILLPCLAGCSDTIESRKEKVSKTFDSELTSLGVDHTIEIVSTLENDYVTNRGKKTNYTFKVLMTIDDDSLSPKEIFDLIEIMDDVRVEHTSLYRFYTVNEDSYYIRDGYILIQGYDYDIAYTPIADKQGVDLTTAEKKAIINWIEKKYERYDSYSGGYSGDKYSDVIFAAASEAFNISLDDLNIIWMKQYS